MTYQPSNRRLCLPAQVWFTLCSTDWYVDDAWENRSGDRVPSAWGREGSKIKIVTHGRRYTLRDERGRYLKRPRPQRGEYRRRVKTFATVEEAARFAIDHAVESCE